jgi:hypothetical protein
MPADTILPVKMKNPMFGTISLPGWAQGLAVKRGLADDTPEPQPPTSEQRRDLLALAECGPVEQAVTYVGATVVTITGVCDALVLPKDQFQALVAGGWVTPGASITPAGRAILSQED